MAAHAQKVFAAHDQFAQFRNLSGLSGATFGVLPNGDPNGRGAMAISTPIAYSLGGGHFAGVLANTSYDRKFHFFSRQNRGDFGVTSNGTAAAMAGISTNAGNFTIGMTEVSGSFENCYSLQYTPRQKQGKLTFAMGAQGLFSAGGFLGPGFHSDADRVVSAFGVATADLGHDVYVSAGWGTSRFTKGFASATVGLTPRIRLVGEHDGFGWNYGLGAELATIRLGGGKRLHLNGFAGMIQTRYAFWSMGFSF